MKIVLPGGTGHVGGMLCRALSSTGHEVVVLSRAPRAAPVGRADPWRVVAWDGRTLDPSANGWLREIDGADVVINLAGRSVDCRYTAANRREIMDSRVLSTRLLGEAISSASRPPRVWLQSSTATIYAHRHDVANDEATGRLGTGSDGAGSETGAPETWRFSIDVAKAWERTLDEAKTPRTRKVALRSAMIMSEDRGSVFDILLGLVRRGLGGRAGDGRQFMSWVHHADFVAILLWLIEHDDVAGPVNVASPNPLTNAEFMRVLREAWGMPIGLPASRWMIEVGTFFLRTESELILKSRRVVPGRLLSRGFEFRYPAWQDAARDLVADWRQARLARLTPVPGTA